MGVLLFAAVLAVMFTLYVGMMSLYYRVRQGRFEIVVNSPSRFSASTDLVRFTVEKERREVVIESVAGTRTIPFEEIGKLAYRYWQHPRGWRPTDWYEIALVLKNGERVGVYVAGQGGRASFQQDLQNKEFGFLSRLGLVRDVEQNSRDALATVRQAFTDAGLELHLA